jgi:hypothetical protein
MKDTHNFLRGTRPVEKSKKRGYTNRVPTKYKRPPGKVLEEARRYKRDVLKLPVVDGEKQ